MIVASGTVLCRLLVFGPGYLRNCPSLCVVMQMLAGNFQGEPLSHVLSCLPEGNLKNTIVFSWLFRMC